MMFGRSAVSFVSRVCRQCHSNARQIHAGGQMHGPNARLSSRGNSFAIHGVALLAVGVGAATLGTYVVEAERISRTRLPVVVQDSTTPSPSAPKTTTKEVEQTTPATTTVKAEEEAITYKYVIVGNGTASYGAVKGIRERDPTSPILVIGEEEIGPYQRPPLSKELWLSDDPDVARSLSFVNWLGQKGSIVYETPDAVAAQGVQLMLGKSVVSLDPEKKTLKLSDGTVIQFETALLATGGTPRRPKRMVDPGADSQVSTYRSVKDFQALIEKVEGGLKHLTIIGGGFLGTELAVAIAHRGKPHGLKITQICPEPGVLHRVLPKYLSDFVTRKLLSAGIDVRASTGVTGIKKATDGSLELSCSSWNDYSDYADHAVLCVGISPNVQVAEAAGLETDPVNGGILVNADLEARAGIYSAGDVCSYHDVALGRRRVEHYDHAFASGKQAGLNMAGAKTPYKYQSMFWSSLEGLGVAFEAVGVVDSTLKTVAFWETDSASQTPDPSIPAFNVQEYKRGVVYYFNNQNAVVGVLLWNMNGQGIDDARQLLLEKKQYSDKSELKSLISTGKAPGGYIES